YVLVVELRVSRNGRGNLLHDERRMAVIVKSARINEATDIGDYLPVRLGYAGRGNGLPYPLDASRVVRERPVLLVRAHPGQYDVGHPGRFRDLVVFHYKKVERRERLAEPRVPFLRHEAEDILPGDVKDFYTPVYY